MGPLNGAYKKRRFRPLSTREKENPMDKIECSKTKCCTFLGAALLLAAGIGFAGLSVQKGLETFRMEDRVVSVKGLSEKDVEADLAIWTLSYTGTSNELAAVTTQTANTKTIILTFLEHVGFTKEEIEIAPVQAQDLLAQAYRPENVDQGRFIVTQNITLRTNDMAKMDKALSQVDSLLQQGVTLSNTQPPVYMFTKLNDIKPAMLAEAIKNARTSAEEFARDSGADIGDIKMAYQGQFQILPRDPVMYVSEQNQRFKTVRVVSTVDFFVE
jgi:hypothetical protein